MLELGKLTSLRSLISLLASPSSWAQGARVMCGWVLALSTGSES